MNELNELNDITVSNNGDVYNKITHKLEKVYKTNYSPYYQYIIINDIKYFIHILVVMKYRPIYKCDTYDDYLKYNFIHIDSDTDNNNINNLKYTRKFIISLL